MPLSPDVSRMERGERQLTKETKDWRPWVSETVKTWTEFLGLTAAPEQKGLAWQAQLGDPPNEWRGKEGEADSFGNVDNVLLDRIPEESQEKESRFGSELAKLERWLQTETAKTSGVDFKRILLGKGVNGHVYEGYDKRRQRSVAIKEVQLRPGYESSILREALVHSKLSHENILDYIGCRIVGDQKKNLQIVTELMAGGALASLDTATRNQMDPKLCARQVLQALFHLREKDIAHSDIHGGNILVDLLGLKWKVSDFGQAKQGLGESGFNSDLKAFGHTLKTMFRSNPNADKDFEQMVNTCIQSPPNARAKLSEILWPPHDIIPSDE